MVDAKQEAIDLIRKLELQNIQRIAKHGEQPYKAMAVTLLQIAGEEVPT
ncbi:hypothetical protein [Methanosarcina mazei]|nr:hypothetical protein [Methanosarcina mazei]